MGSAFPNYKYTRSPCMLYSLSLWTDPWADGHLNSEGPRPLEHARPASFQAFFGLLLEKRETTLLLSFAVIEGYMSCPTFTLNLGYL